MSFTSIFPSLDVSSVKHEKGLKHVVCFSGGESSAIVAVEVSKRFGIDDLVLLNHDIHKSVESVDIKRFKKQVAAYIGVPITYANMKGVDKKDQFDVVIEAGIFQTPKGQAVCTSRLKTEPFRAWLETNVPDKNCICYYGFSSDEMRRINRRRQIMGIQGYQTDFPLAYWKERTINSITDIGIEPPLVYDVFKHANCVGCLKAGAQHWYIVFCTRKDIWEKAKRTEEELGRTIIKEHSLESLECKFQLMQKAGVPATEKLEQSKFWSTTELVIGQYLQRSDDRPCECVS